MRTPDRMTETVCFVSHAALMQFTQRKKRRAQPGEACVSWPPVTDSLPAVEEEAAAAGGAAPAELVREEEELSPTWVGLERVLAAVASLCWLTTDGWRRRAPGTAACPVWKV